MASQDHPSSAAAASPETPLSLTVIEPSGTARYVEVTRSPFRIGRLPESDLSLPDNRISRQHAQILLEDGKYYIEDCDSRHGLFVNGQKVERHELRPRDRIEFGGQDAFQLVVGVQPVFTAPLMRKVAKMPAAEGTGNLGRLSAVIEVARALESSGSVDDVLVAAVDAALTVTGAERGFLMLKSEAGELEIQVARDREGKALTADELRVPRGVIQQALLRRRDLFSMTIDAEQGAMDAAAAGQTVVALELRSVVCVPLVRIRIGLQHETSHLSPSEDTLGVLYMDSRRAGTDLAAGNRELLQSLAIEISTVLEHARLLDETRKKQLLDKELTIAREIQRALLPALLPSEGWLVAAGSSEACFQVGGDYFDVMQLSVERWGAVMADVSGKGVSAALLTSLLQGAFFSISGEEGQIAESVGRINRYVCERSRNARFATVFCCAVDHNGLTQWINAGHCATLVARSSGEVEWLGPTTVPLGLFPDATFPAKECQLAPGDKLVIYTDGVSEATNSSNELFGEERLKKVVVDHVARGAADLHEVLRQELTAFTSGAAQKDDLTLLVLEYKGGAS